MGWVGHLVNRLQTVLGHPFHDEGAELIHPGGLPPGRKAQYATTAVVACCILPV
jgi:hypothetical protein